MSVINSSLRCLFGAVLLMLCLFAVNIQTSLAYQAVVVTPSEPYEVFEIDNSLTTETWYLGQLDSYPQMYGLSLLRDTVVNLSLRILDDVDMEIMRPNLLLVKRTMPQGVEEIIRMDFDSEKWKLEKDSQSNLAYYAPDVLELNLTAGEYKVEITTANNEGKYMLVLWSDEQKESFAARWETVGKLYDFYGVSRVRILGTSLVYFPLGILILLILLGVTWLNRSRLKIR